MNISVGLQLFSVRGECDKNLPLTIEEVARIGYAGAELYSFNGESLEWKGIHCTQLRKHFDDNSLRCCGAHISVGALLGDNLQRSIEFHQTMGNRFLIVAMDKDRMTSHAGVKELVAILNEASEQLKPHGMYTGYHAHGFDHTKLEDGQIAWDVLFASTNPEVIMQMDVGNYSSGGGDPIGTLRRFPNRARSVHLKEYGGAPDSVIGEGTLNWKEIFEICETIQNTEWYVVEEGGADGNGFDISRRSFEALKKMGIV